MALQKAEQWIRKKGSLVLEGKSPVLVGMDEAGRGPWAGPVVACALFFPQISADGKKLRTRISGIQDSKKLSKIHRKVLFDQLSKQAVFGLGVADNVEIDGMGLIPATNLAFTRALKDLATKSSYSEPTLLLIDGRDKFQLPFPSQSIIRGDGLVVEIAAASIMAKVFRDELMEQLARAYPGYGFELHKGYGTALHTQKLKELGVSNIHRQSYRPVAEINSVK